MKNMPLVTVNILSYNRKEELRNTLTKVYEQDYKNIEVIVVDNASVDGSSDMVINEFPAVQLIRMPANIGIAGWNEGFKVAKGEYVFVLDDDSYPIHSTITVCVEKLLSNFNVAVIACKIISKTEITDIDPGVNLQDSPVTSFIGCGAVIRKNILEKVGGFEKELFIYFHEVEYSMRVINTEWEIMFCPASLVVHNVSEINRKLDSLLIDDRKIFYDTRNLIIIIFLHFPLIKSSFLLLRIILGRLLFGILNKKLRIVFGALNSALIKIIGLRKKRYILKESVRAKYLYGSFAGGFFFFNSNYGIRKPEWLKSN